jgi:hypothetical protein
MKLLSLFLLFMAINLGLLVFNLGISKEMADNSAKLGATGAQASWSTVNPGSTADPNVDNSKYTSSTLLNAFLDPTGGNNASIVLYVIAFALLIGALSFVPFINRSDLSVLSGPFILLVGVSGPTIVGLWSFINGQSSGYFCDLGSACLISNLLGAIVAGTLFIAWIFACVEWWTGRPSS